MTRVTIARLIAPAAFLFMPVAAQAQIPDSAALERRAAQVVALIGGAEANYDTVFNATMLKAVPAAQLRGVFTQLAGLGHVQRTTIGKQLAGSPAVEFQLVTDKTYSIPMTLAVESVAPNLISGLFFGAPV